MSYPRPDARTHHRVEHAGLRGGTCSLGYILRATSTPEMVAGVPYSDISTHTMLPVSHVVWSSVWLGIADAAVEKARKYVRAAARKQPGVTSPPGALRLAEVAASAQQFADLVGASARRYDRAVHAEEGVADFEATGAVGFSLAMNNLKVTASTAVVEIVGQTMLICGISGYREDTEFSLGRHLRDAHGAAVMVNNDRIMQVQRTWLSDTGGERYDERDCDDRDCDRRDRSGSGPGCIST